MNRFIILLTIVLLASCTQTVEIQLEPQVEIYFSSDNERRITLNQSDSEYTAINEWLINNRSNWRPTSGNYPGGVYIKSGDYGIQVTKTHVILYSTTAYKPKAIYIQGLDKDKLSGIKKLGNF